MLIKYSNFSLSICDKIYQICKHGIHLYIAIKKDIIKEICYRHNYDIKYYKEGKYEITLYADDAIYHVIRDGKHITLTAKIDLCDYHVNYTNGRVRHASINAFNGYYNVEFKRGSFIITHIGQQKYRRRVKSKKIEELEIGHIDIRVFKLPYNSSNN